MKKRSVILFLLLLSCLFTTFPPGPSYGQTTFTDNFENEDYVSSTHQLFYTGNSYRLGPEDIGYLSTELYGSGNYDSSRVFNRNHPSGELNKRSAVGQSFVADSDFDLARVGFYSWKIGNPNGTAYARLYDISGTMGTNAVPNNLLATSSGRDLSDWEASPTWEYWNFDPVYSCTSSGEYWIGVGFVTGGDLDDDNNIKVAGDKSSPTHEGNEATYHNSAWTPVNARDFIFEVFEFVPYYTEGTLYSENLLQSLNVTEIYSFTYNASIVSFEHINFQFSQDNTTWYNSTHLGGWYPGIHSGQDGSPLDVVNLGVLDWDGGFFYYRANFSDPTGTPELFSISLSYSTELPSFEDTTPEYYFYVPLSIAIMVLGLLVSDVFKR